MSAAVSTANGPPTAITPTMPTWLTWKGCDRPSVSSTSRWWEPPWGRSHFLDLRWHLPREGGSDPIFLRGRGVPLPYSYGGPMTIRTTEAVDRFVKVGDLNLHYLEWGVSGAPPVVMIHGLKWNAHAFDSLAPHFVPRYHVISVDPRPCRQRMGRRRRLLQRCRTWLTWKGCDRLRRFRALLAGGNHPWGVAFP